MSTTIAHPRSIPSGPSGKTVAGFLVGALLAAAVGYGVVNLGEPVSGQIAQSTATGADQVITQKGANLAAEWAAAVARGEHMQSINELGFPASGAVGADLGAAEEARRRGERMFQINSFGEEPSKLESGGPRSPLVVE